MRADAVLETQDLAPPASGTGPPTDILVTGATGFFGAFCLESLLRTTTMTCHVLVRAGDAAHGLNRIRAALRRAGAATPLLDEALRRRVRVVCGDLAAPRLGLAPDAWDALAGTTQAVFHCAALVNYNLTYDALRAANVEATRELLRLAAARVRKTFHFVSTTFIFGWTTLPLLLEHDDNAAMATSISAMRKASGWPSSWCSLRQARDFRRASTGRRRSRHRPPDRATATTWSCACSHS